MNYLAFVGRILIGLPFAMSGLSKLAAYGPTTAKIAAVRLPFPSLAFAVAVAVELGGGLLLVLGYRVRPWAGSLLARDSSFRSTAISPTRTR
jgi:putative oxidoreductase